MLSVTRMIIKILKQCESLSHCSLFLSTYEPLQKGFVKFK